ncbi:MAG: bifunctional phosphoribosylaminoimidazolecarboxamide formyltransferase/IMP cyclohydrolase [Spirochaetota bacterium]
MNTARTTVTRALLSVSNKEGIVSLAENLQALGVELISTGGTKRVLEQAGMQVRGITELTGFPEMMDGRVKTLHPLVHGGILGLRDTHKEEANTHSIPWIDLVVCNLYPFEETIEDDEVSFEQAVEQIDIGGPTMIRSAAKNVGWVSVLVNPQAYSSFIEELKRDGGISYPMRKALSAAAFRHTAQYDALIQSYLTEEPFPEELTLTYRQYSALRYGENPHQKAAAYHAVLPPDRRDHMSILNAEVLNGKQLSYNNINDAAGTLATLREFDKPACVVVKHANPCGTAEGEDLPGTVEKAFNADRLSAFGGLVAINRTCTQEIATFFKKLFIEVFMAPDFEPEALQILQNKKNLRVLKLGPVRPLNPVIAAKHVEGGLLLQDRDCAQPAHSELEVVTEKQPSQKELEDMLFAWKVLKHVKSNAILTAKDKATQGIGPGQVSRVDAVKIAIEKSAQTEGAVLASDAFFPFRDSIDSLRGTGIAAVIQPGGSIRDNEVIEACNELGIAMVFTRTRCFYHG